MKELYNALLLACIHPHIFLDYDKIIDISASKYPRMMLSINPLKVKTKLLNRLTLKEHINLKQTLAFLLCILLHSVKIFILLQLIDVGTIHLTSLL